MFTFPGWSEICPWTRAPAVDSKVLLEASLATQQPFWIKSRELLIPLYENMWMSARLLTWSTGNSLPPDDSLLHKYLPRTKDSLIHLSLNQPHLHLPAALPCALLTSLKALVGAFHSLVWTGFTCLCQTQKHSTSLSSHPVEQGCHIIVFLLVFNRLKINIAFLYSPDGGADTKLAPEAKPFISHPSSIIGPNHTTLTPKKETLRSDNGVQQHYQISIIMLPIMMGRHHPHWCTSSHFVV